MNKLFDFFIRYFSILVKIILILFSYFSFQENGISNYNVLFLFPLVNLTWMLPFSFYQSHFLNYNALKKSYLIIIDSLFVFLMILTILMKISNIIFIDFALLPIEFFMVIKAEKKIDINKNIKNVIVLPIFINIGFLFSSGMFYLENYKYLFYVYNVLFIFFMICLSIGIFILIEFKSKGNIKISSKKKSIMYLLYTIALLLSIGVLRIDYINHEMTGISINGCILYYLIFGIYPLALFRINSYYAENEFLEKNETSKVESLE